MPFKILDAPELQDDFYLNLVDWSSLNVLAVGLARSVYIWSACTSVVARLCELPENDLVTSVSWSKRGNYLSIGTYSGQLQIWDAAKGKLFRTMDGHLSRVGVSAWAGGLVASGSRDRTILMRDIRQPEDFFGQNIGHKQEVCGMKWSPDLTQLASGGNDNKLFIWDARHSDPLARFSEHRAAVKAIGWNPSQRGLLASGGGTADRCIRFWNTLSLQQQSYLDTGSQVCNLMFSNNNELVTTHGYSLNQIILWKYPTMEKIETLQGHTFRVLYLCMSPDGQSICTGAGDETLRFWNVFPRFKNNKNAGFGVSQNTNALEIR